MLTNKPKRGAKLLLEITYNVLRVSLELNFHYEKKKNPFQYGLIINDRQNKQLNIT